MMLWILNQWGRLVFWIKNDHWCTDHVWGDWEMVDLGREKIRFCQCCHWMETTNHPWRGLFRSFRTRRAVRTHGPTGEPWDSFGLDDDRMDAARRAVEEIKKRTTTEGEGS